MSQQEPKPTITKKLITKVQSLDPTAVKKNILENFVTKNTNEFDIRNQNRQDNAILEKTAIKSSLHKPDLTAQQNREIDQRLSVSENSGTRVGKQRSVENDIMCVQKKYQLDVLRNRAKNQKEKQNIERQIVKLQRKCNHSFQGSSQCELCGKNKTDHV